MLLSPSLYASVFFIATSQSIHTKKQKQKWRDVFIQIKV